MQNPKEATLQELIDQMISLNTYYSSIPNLPFLDIEREKCMARIKIVADEIKLRSPSTENQNEADELFSGL